MGIPPQHISHTPLLPFLKWAGGKRKLANTILKLIGPGRHLLEPFVGAGAVFGASKYPAVILGDINSDLIDLYKALQTDVHALLTECRPLFLLPCTRREFLTQRTLFNASSRNLTRAARFLYLNSRGYNGLCRYNRRGEFNVPFGGEHRTSMLPTALLMEWHHRLAGVEVIRDDFEQVMERAQPGDVVYCDPPYAPLQRNAGFTTYSAGGFDWANHVRLAAVARRLARRDVVVAISNHDTATIRELYADANIHALTAPRHISCTVASRRSAAEIIAVYGSASLAR